MFIDMRDSLEMVKADEEAEGRRQRAEVDRVIKSYRDLIVWQKSMTMVTAVYEATRRFPAEELYGLTAQIRRAAVSITSNIAEGYSRNSTADYIRFLRIACGSLYELRTQLEIAVNLGYMKAAA
jgi:four helix bundle protein